MLDSGTRMGDRGKNKWKTNDCCDVRATPVMRKVDKVGAGGWEGWASGREEAGPLEGQQRPGGPGASPAGEHRALGDTWR